MLYRIRMICLLTGGLLCLSVFLFTGCRQKNRSPALFELLSPGQTGIGFTNELDEGPGNNILESEFFYNGGGVAVGDINNDGLPDLYFTANQGRNGLYLNRGDYRFEDITDHAGVSDSGGWSAGAVMADINADGHTDIYVCKAGNLGPDERRNKLYINNGVSQGDEQVPVFTESAASFGLDDPGYCTQSVFFDYDGDGLLDLFIVNYNTKHFTGFDIRTIRDEHDPYAGDKLYRNNGTSQGDGQAPAFTDVSAEAGIHQNPIGFGLSATASDLNNDGLPDIYVTNDYMERDYMYINQGDGTFSDEILQRTDVLSYFSMGSDIADINNDGFPDIFVADMLPPEYERRSVFKTPEYGIYEELASNGYHRKNMRNTLQLNNGDGTFSEIGRLAGVSMTDWSWAPLIADFDNDGFKDIVVTNGFPRFYTDLDYLNDVLWAQYPDEDLPDDPALKYDLVREMKEVEMHNFVFRNRGDLTFGDVTDSWGLERMSVSGGAAYADLNNSGALDLIISNINEPAFVFKNLAGEQNGHHYLKLKLKGTQNNPLGTGSKVTVTGENGAVFYQEVYQTRGFQSSSDPVLHFGLGSTEAADVEVIWPDQTRQIFRNVAPNQTLLAEYSKTEPADSLSGSGNSSGMFVWVDPETLGIEYSHQRSFFRDRLTDPLLPHTLSNPGPAMSVADVNRDGLEDIFIGGGQGQAGMLYLQQSAGTFAWADVPVFEEHSAFEDTDALFFDASGDGHPDLYVVSGGNFDSMNGEAYQDRLYMNNGFGNFTYYPEALPLMHTSGGSVTVADIDGNSLPDLFVGGRVTTGRYPEAPRSYLLQNSEGVFTDITAEAAPELMHPGMVSDAVWTDIDGDEQGELVVAGEWMPVRVFKKNTDEGAVRFDEVTGQAGLGQTAGWWNVLEAADLNDDGFTDLIAGNRGLNADFHASAENPAILYYGDFNGNGLKDPVITSVTEGRRYPVEGRDAFRQLISNFEEKFPDYATWARADINDILTANDIDNANLFYAHTFASAVFLNDGSGTFKEIPLPPAAQAAPIYDIIVDDFFGGGEPGILAAGNNFGNRPQTGPSAGRGVLIRPENRNEGVGFFVLPGYQSGFFAPGEVRSIEWVSTRYGPVFFLGRYGDSVLSYLYQPNSN